MKALKPSERSIATAIETILYSNPFAPERIAAERQALGERFCDTDAVWNGSDLSAGERANVTALQPLAENLANGIRARVRDGAKWVGRDAELYESVVVYVLYYRRHATLRPLARAAREGPSAAGLAACFDGLVEDVAHFFDGVLPAGAETVDAAHLFACFFQIVRAFDPIIGTIVGTSLPSGRLRGAIWQSIFTHDMRRYRRSLYDKTGDFTTLIVGPSGTGKELVARAIGSARYVPFSAKKKAFVSDVSDLFFPLNLSALSPTLVESELFGHRRGAFTGAVVDRKGWLATCPPLGSVFLDEIGELDPAIQVKLLRVLQTRQFQTLGDTQTLQFRGKIIAATHRDLDADMRAGRFRRDFYYRLCSDVIETPSLAEQLGGSADELRRLVWFVATRLCPGEADGLTEQVMATIGRHLGLDYAWPGNFRELEQCVRNVMIRGEYHASRPMSTTEADGLASRLAAGALTADEVLDAYCAHVYALTGTFQETARRLGLDRRTVRARVGRSRVPGRSRGRTG